MTDNRLSAEITPESLNHAQILLAHLPETLRQQLSIVTSATGFLAGLLFSRQSDIRSQQEKRFPPDALPTARELYKWLSAQPEAGAQYRLVLLDLAMPALRETKDTERQQLIVLAKDLIRADGRVSPTEFTLYTILSGSLLAPSERRVKRGELRLKQLGKDIASLLALLAHAGHKDEQEAEAAYQAAMDCSPAGITHPFPAKSDLSLNRISEALSNLALAAPPYRKKLLEACEAAVQRNGKITPAENELLRAFAQSLDCPAPLA